MHNTFITDCTNVEKHQRLKMYIFIKKSLAQPLLLTRISFKKTRLLAIFILELCHTEIRNLVAIFGRLITTFIQQEIKHLSKMHCFIWSSIQYKIFSVKYHCSFVHPWFMRTSQPFNQALDKCNEVHNINHFHSS